MKLYLIRHAQAIGNQEQCFLGAADHPLTKEGVQECACIIAPSVQRIFTSPLIRCTQTAALLFPEIAKVSIDGLREYDFGVFEGKNHQQLLHDPDYLTWLSANGSRPPPGGEAWGIFCARCQESFAQLIESCLLAENHDTAVVTHGGVIMEVLHHFGHPAQELYAWRTENLGGWILTIEKETWERERIFFVAQMERVQKNV